MQKQKQLFATGLTGYILGILSGIVIQKFFPVGQLLGIDITTALTSIHSPKPHQEITLDTIRKLPASQVMIAIVCGQSNAANTGDVLHTAGEGVYSFYQGKFYKAQDPLLGADGKGGSVWPLLGDKLIASKRYKAVIFVPLAVGTTEISRWSTTGDLFPKIQNAARDLQKLGLTPTHLLWHQGETDGRLRTSTKLYKTEFLEMRAGLRNMGVQAPFYVCLASRCMKQPPIASVRAAQRELAQEYPDIESGPDTDALGLSERHDGCHLSNQGQQKFAEMWMEKLK